MVPLKLCGIYVLTSCTNTAYIGSRLTLDYNSIHFALIKKVAFIKVTKNLYGSILVKEDAETVKVMWLNSGTYDVDMSVLPVISYPYIKDNCRRMLCSYSAYDNWITIQDKNDKYVFRKNLYPDKENNTFLKMLCTQLFLDLIIRHFVDQIQLQV